MEPSVSGRIVSIIEKPHSQNRHGMWNLLSLAVLSDMGDKLARFAPFSAMCPRVRHTCSWNFDTHQITRMFHLSEETSASSNRSRWTGRSARMHTRYEIHDHRVVTEKHGWSADDSRGARTASAKTYFTPKPLVRRG